MDFRGKAVDDGAAGEERLSPGNQRADSCCWFRHTVPGINAAFQVSLLIYTYIAAAGKTIRPKYPACRHQREYHWRVEGGRSSTGCPCRNIYGPGFQSPPAGSRQQNSRRDHGARPGVISPGRERERKLLHCPSSSPSHPIICSR